MEEIVGFRLHPTDHELVNHYLRHKNAGRDWLVDNGINEVDMCAHDPWELPDKAKIKSNNDPALFFFCRPELKHSNSQRARNSEYGIPTGKNRDDKNRATKTGSWKPTGKDREIKENGITIGIKKTLVFHKRGQKKGTSWVMHEYHATFVPPTRRPYVVCKVMNKEGENGCISSSEVGESSRSLASASLNLASSSNATSEINNQIQATPQSFINIAELDYDMVDWSEIMQFCGPESDRQNSDLVQPISNVNVEDQQLMEGLEFTDPKIVEELFANPDEFSNQNSVFHTNYNSYRPQQFITGEYVDSSSDTDSETTDQKGFEEIAGPIDSVGSSKGSNKIFVGGFCGEEIQTMDTSTEHSAIIDQLSNNTKTCESQNKAKEAPEPKKAIDFSKKSSIKSLSTSIQMMDIHIDESVTTEEFSSDKTACKAQNKAKQAAELRTILDPSKKSSTSVQMMDVSIKESVTMDESFGDTKTRKCQMQPGKAKEAMKPTRLVIHFTIVLVAMVLFFFLW